MHMHMHVALPLVSALRALCSIDGRAAPRGRSRARAPVARWRVRRRSAATHGVAGSGWLHWRAPTRCGREWQCLRCCGGYARGAIPSSARLVHISPLTSPSSEPTLPTMTTSTHPPPFMVIRLLSIHLSADGCSADRWALTSTSELADAFATLAHPSLLAPSMELIAARLSARAPAAHPWSMPLQRIDAGYYWALHVRRDTRALCSHFCRRSFWLHPYFGTPRGRCATD